MKAASPLKPDDPESTADNSGRTLLVILAIAPAVVSLAILPEAADSSVLRLPVLFILALALAAGSAGTVIGRLRSDPDLRALLLGFAAVLAAGGLSMISAISTGSGLSELGRIASCGLIVAAVSMVRLPRESDLLINCLLLLAAVLCAAGMLQLIPGNPLRIWHEQGVASTLGNASFFAGWLAGLLPLTFAEAVRRSSVPRFILAGTMVTMASLTGSRSAWIGAAAGLLLAAVMLRGANPRRTVLIAAIVLICAAAGIAAAAFSGILNDIVGPVSSMRRRFFFYDAAWDAFVASPLTGNGAGNFRYFMPLYRSPDYWTSGAEDISEHVHNEFLELLSETGVVGVVAVAILAVVVVRRVANAPIPDRGRRFVVAGAAGGLAAILVDNLASTNLRTVPVAVLASVLTGLLVGGGARTTAVRPVTGHMRFPRWASVLGWVGAAVAAGFVIVGASDHALAERHMLRGNLLRWDGEIAASTAEYRLVIGHRPAHSEARMYLATNLLQGGSYPEAASQIDTVLIHDPWLPKARVVRALALMESGDLAGARETILDELKIGRTLQALYYCALIHRRVGGDDENGIERAYLIELVERAKAAGRDEYVAEARERLAELGGL